MINCDKFVSLITDYLDGTLGEQEKAEFNEHLLACKNCAPVFQRIKILRQHLKKLPSLKTSSTFEVVLRSRLRRELGRNRNWNWISNPWAKVSVVGLSAAALFLVAFVSLNYFFTSNNEQRISTNEVNPIGSQASQVEEQVFFVIEDLPADIFITDQQQLNLPSVALYGERVKSTAITNGDSINFSSNQLGFKSYTKSLATVTF